MRKAISKKLRFEIFKRDSFSCIYCGKGTAAGAVLNIDHIIPVAKNGTNDQENLVTACFDCNSGKSDRELNNLSIIKTDMASINLKEYKSQVAAFFKYSEEKNNTLNMVVDLVLKNIGNESDFNDKQKQSIRVFLTKLSFEQMIDYSILASSKLANRSAYSKFKYLCGICHNVINNKARA